MPTRPRTGSSELPAEITERQYLTVKSDIFRLAEVKNPGNVLHHSFGSYHVAEHKDAATLMLTARAEGPRRLR